MLVNVVGVALELLKRERGVIVEALTGGAVQEFVEGVIVEFAALAFFVFAQNLFFGGSQHAIEAPQDGHGQHDALVLRGTVWTAQQVGDLPDEIGNFVMIRHGV